MTTAWSAALSARPSLHTTLLALLTIATLGSDHASTPVCRSGRSARCGGVLRLRGGKRAGSVAPKRAGNAADAGSDADDNEEAIRQALMEEFGDMRAIEAAGQQFLSEGRGSAKADALLGPMSDFCETDLAEEIKELEGASRKDRNPRAKKGPQHAPSAAEKVVPHGARTRAEKVRTDRSAVVGEAKREKRRRDLASEKSPDTATGTAADARGVGAARQAGAKKKQRVEPAITEWLESSDDARGASRVERLGATEEGEEDGAESSEPPSDFLVAPDAVEPRGVPARGGRCKKRRTNAGPGVAGEAEGQEAAGDSGESLEESAAALDAKRRRRQKLLRESGALPVSASLRSLRAFSQDSAGAGGGGAGTDPAGRQERGKHDDNDDRQQGKGAADDTLVAGGARDSGAAAERDKRTLFVGNVPAGPPQSLVRCAERACSMCPSIHKPSICTHVRGRAHTHPHVITR